MNSIFANLYEICFYQQDFSQAVYTSGLYTFLGLSSFTIPLIIGLLYYKVIDRPNLASHIAWLLFGAGASLLSFIISYGIVYSSLSSNYDFEGEYFTISLYSALFTIVSYILYSFILKNFSVNCKNIPL